MIIIWYAARQHGRWGGRMMIIYLAVILAAGLLYVRLPSSFLPNEDQGTMLVNIQLPPGATLERTQAVIEQVEAFTHLRLNDGATRESAR